MNLKTKFSIALVLVAIVGVRVDACFATVGAKPAPFLNSLWQDFASDQDPLALDDLLLLASGGGNGVQILATVLDDTIDGFKQDVKEVVSWFSDKVLFDLIQHEYSN